MVQIIHGVHSTSRALPMTVDERYRSSARPTPGIDLDRPDLNRLLKVLTHHYQDAFEIDHTGACRPLAWRHAASHAWMQAYGTLLIEHQILAEGTYRKKKAEVVAS